MPSIISRIRFVNLLIELTNILQDYHWIYFDSDETDFQIRKHPSSSSFCNEEVEDDPNKRKENQVIGSIKFSTYKTFFKAAHSQIFVIVVFILYIMAQAAWSGADYFLSEW